MGWVDLLNHGAPQARFAHQSSAMKNYDLEVYLTTVNIAKTNALNVIIQGCFSKAVAMYIV